MLPTFIADAFRRAPGGVVTTRELGRIGVPRPWVTALVDDGLLERMLYGVHRDPAAEPPPTQGLQLPLKYLEQRRPSSYPSELVTGRAALGAHGVPGMALTEPLVLVHRPRRVRRIRPAFDLRRVDLTTVEHDRAMGVRVTSPMDAVADAALCTRTTDLMIRTAVDHLRQRRALDIVVAARRWAALPHPGGRRLTRMVAAGCFEQESEGERNAFAHLFVPHGVLPDCQVWMTPSIRVDFAFLSAALVVEYHGGVHDGSVDEDATRAWALRNLGLELVVVTKSMMRQAPLVADQIAALRTEREQLAREGRILRPALPAQPPRLTPLRTMHLR